MASPENTYMSNIIQTEQVIIRNVCVYTYVHVKTTHEERGNEFQREQGEGYVGEFGGRKEKEEMM